MGTGEEQSVASLREAEVEAVATSWSRARGAATSARDPTPAPVNSSDGRLQLTE